MFTIHPAAVFVYLNLGVLAMPKAAHIASKSREHSETSTS
jgi:hypothetical protein